MRRAEPGYDLAVPDPVTERPAICLNMIVRNEAHIVGELLGVVAPFIASWVIVDTGSDDGTPDVIRSRMATLGIAGELHERPWRSFGQNRSEALALAQGRGDYIWVIDADDMVVGTPDFSRLGADAYRLHYEKESGLTYWRLQLFRDGLRWRYDGAVHEYPACDDPFVEERLGGDYRIESRRLGARSLDPLTYPRDRDLLLDEVDRNPDDTRSVFYLAQTYFDLGDFLNAREWYARRVDLGGWGEEVYCAMVRLAETMSRLGMPWPEVQDAYLQAWEFRPIRAEALYAIACRYRRDGRYWLGHLFADRAAKIPLPERDSLFVRADIHAWRAADEQAVCASWIGKREEAFGLWRRVLAQPGVPDEDRRRIAANRDLLVPKMLDAASGYPEKLAQGLTTGGRHAEVTVTLVAGPDLAAAELTLNSFLHCCVDVERVGRFVVIDGGLATEDRAKLAASYPFLAFSGTGVGLMEIRDQIRGPFWLHLGEGWRFFAPERLITRLSAVLAAEPEVFQVGVNFADAAQLATGGAADHAARRATEAGGYVLTDAVATGPAMFDTARLDRAGIGEPGPRAAKLQTASLDEVLCIRTV